jgi:DNA-binding LacI/PurR family transcriptional regulator
MPTQKELAKLAGVSAGTVSNVISGSTRVSERARQKVLKAIKELDYRPNLIARSLKTNRTDTLGIVVPDITVAFFTKILRGAESAAREQGYFSIVLDSESQPARENEMLALLRAHRVDGILLITAGGHSTHAEIAHLKSGPPIVYLDRLPDGLGVDSVSVDDRSAAEMAIAHLLAMGHTDIAILTGPLTLKNEQERLRGFKQAMQKAGLPIRESLVWPGSFDSNEIAAICQKALLGSSRRPTALFTTNGVTGLAALRSMYAAGLATPRDIAFVTFDEIVADEFFKPAITTVVQPAYEIGRRAVEILLDRLHKGKEAGPPRRVRLPGTLAVRESTKEAQSRRR